MSETMFVDRRNATDRRSHSVSPGLVRCRRRAQDRRRGKEEQEPSDNWWLNINYAAEDTSGSK